MALLSFPSSPVNGQLYPVAPIVGQNQYQWEALTNTWRLLGAATAVAPGTFGDVSNIPQFTVDITGKITFATNIPIDSTYVKTNNTAAYNGYVWPLADGLPSSFLSTDGSGNLSWQDIPFTNYWSLFGTTLLPSTQGYNLALTDAGGNLTFYSDTATSETDFINGTTAVVISPVPLGTSTITVSGGGNTAEPLGFLASNFDFKAYGNSFLNSPSTLAVTQTLLSTTTPFSSESYITFNAGTANSVTTPPTRGTAGQILITNGDGTTSWVTDPEQGWWARTGTNIYPENPGDTVQIRNLASVPVIELKPDGNGYFIDGLQNFQINPGYAAGEVELRVNDFPGAGILQIDSSIVNLRSYGPVYTNDPAQFQVDYTTGIVFNAMFTGTRRNLFTIDLNGSIQTGFNVIAGYPAFFADGTNGDTRVAGILTVNGGVSFSPTPQSYSFPNNRGLNGYVLVTDGAGGTQWQSASALQGYWSQSVSTLDIYPTKPGQNVFIKDNTAVNAIEMYASGRITAFGGDINNPAFAISNNGAGMYGDNLHLRFAVNAVQAGEFSETEFHSNHNIRITGESTDFATDAVISNDNDNLVLTSSGSALNVKGIIFEIAPAIPAGYFTNTKDFVVTEGNVALGSTNVVNYVDSFTLAIGDVIANKKGLLKFASLYNGGDGVELTQDDGTGDFTIQMNHSAAPVFTINATDTILDTTLNVLNDTTLASELYLPSPTVPPASTSPGVKGQIAWDANYIYICIATNTWKRTALTTW